MDIPKTIEILTGMKETTLNYYSPDRNHALQLGIEALKRTTDRRSHLGWELEPPLPGETVPPSPPKTLGYDPDL